MSADIVDPAVQPANLCGALTAAPRAGPALMGSSRAWPKVKHRESGGPVERVTIPCHPRVQSTGELKAGLKAGIDRDSRAAPARRLRAFFCAKIATDFS